MSKRDLRKAARGQECDLRYPGVCNGDTETVVLAHIRRGGVAGVGQKPPDVVGVYACSACHDALDGRTTLPLLEMQHLDSYTLEALCRRLAAWSRDGLV